MSITLKFTTFYITFKLIFKNERQKLIQFNSFVIEPLKLHLIVYKKKLNKIISK